MTASILIQTLHTNTSKVLTIHTHRCIMSATKSSLEDMNMDFEKTYNQVRSIAKANGLHYLIIAYSEIGADKCQPHTRTFYSDEWTEIQLLIDKFEKEYSKLEKSGVFYYTFFAE